MLTPKVIEKRRGSAHGPKPVSATPAPAPRRRP